MPSSLLASDYIIEEKDAMLQKKENEGFGFVLRGAKGKHDQNLHLSTSPQVAAGLNDAFIHGSRIETQQNYNHSTMKLLITPGCLLLV